MNRNVRLVIVLVVAIASAGVASFAAYRAVQNLPAKEVEVGGVPTVVAARPLQVGTLVTRGDLKIVSWPERALVPGSFRSVDAVVNRGLVAAASENEPITESKIAAAGAGAGLPPTIPQGMRAMSLKVNDVVGVAGFVVPGTRVDVVVTIRSAQGGSMSRIVLDNITVLASGTRNDQARPGAQAAPSLLATVVTLLVTPEQAERLTLAGSEGTITLVLRNPLDAQPVQTAGARVTALLGGGAAPAPAEAPAAPRRVVRAQAPPPQPEPPKPYVVETIRAAKRSEEAIR
jgi:pilus assembly protein CpaB